MKNAAIGGVIALGIAMMGYLAGSGWHHPQMDFPYLMGRMSIGLVVLIIGLILRRRLTEPLMKLWPPLTIGTVIAFLLFSSQLLIPYVIFHVEAGEPWTYQSETPNFAVTLPSPNWNKVEDEQATVAFASSRAFVGVKVVPKVDRQGFELRTLAFQQMLQKMVTNPIEELAVDEGKTSAGDPLISWKTIALNDGKKVYVSAAMIYLPEKEMLVRMVLEARLRMRSQVGKKAELEYFDQSARSIRRSVK